MNRPASVRSTTDVELLVERFEPFRRCDGDEAGRLIVAGIPFARGEYERRDVELMSRRVVWSDADELPDPVELAELAWT